MTAETVTCNCAAVPPTMPTYRTKHLLSCPAWIFENAANVIGRVTEPVTVSAETEVPGPAAAALATRGTEQAAPAASVPHKHKWILIECNGDRDRYECACGEYFTERCSFDEEYS